MDDPSLVKANEEHSGERGSAHPQGHSVEKEKGSLEQIDVALCVCVM
jgi:hypothetical protein